MEALRCLKRILARRIWQLLRDHTVPKNSLSTTNSNNADAPAPALALT
jgi:hypothetical protein